MRGIVGAAVLVVLLGLAGAEKARSTATPEECIGKLSEAASKCSTCLNRVNKIAYQRLDRVFTARGNSAFRLDVSRFFHLAVGFSQDTVKAPQGCCRIAAELFSPQFQRECACLPEVVQHTKWFDKELVDYYYDFLKSSCPLDQEGEGPGTASWDSCGLAHDTFITKAQDAAFAIPEFVDQAVGAGHGVAAGVAAAAGGVAAGVAGGVAGKGAAVAGKAAAAAGPFGRRRRMQEGGPLEEAADGAVTVMQGQCDAAGRGTRVALNNASVPFYFLCPATKGHCSTGACVFGRTAAAPKGQWATCQPISSCNGIEVDLSGCFPGAATVQLPGGATKRMSDLRVGDKVLAAGPGGRLEYQDVYFFGHRASEAEAKFVRIELGGGAAALELTPDHFVPVLPAAAAGLQGGDHGAADDAGAALALARMTYARDVRAGDVMLLAPGGVLRAAAVTAVGAVRRVGLYNPYTLGGTIVVDGVVASSHSGWLVDGAAARLGLSHLLPGFFQALLAPLRALYSAAGPASMQTFGDALAAAALRLEAAVLAPAGAGARLEAGPAAAAAAAAVAASAAAAALKQQRSRRRRRHARSAA